MSKKSASILSFIVIPLFILSIIISRKALIYISGYYPECLFHKFTVLLCPACGNTRAVTAILKLRFVEAASYNITPLIAIIICTALYIELCMYAMGKRVIIIPRNNYFLGGVLAFMCIYYILRNVVLFI